MHKYGYGYRYGYGMSDTIEIFEKVGHEQWGYVY